MRKVAGRLRLELSQYRELEAFAQFGSDLDADTQATLNRGARLVEALNQDERSPWAIEDQVAAIYSGTGGYLDRIKVERVKDFHESMLQRLHSEHQELMDKLHDGEWDDSIESELSDAIAEAIDDFGPDFDAEGNPLEEGESDRIRAEQQRDRDSGSEDGDEESGAESDSGSGEAAEETEEQQAAPA
jgi:F-type H+-transporting ATPase subunit alpha